MRKFKVAQIPSSRVGYMTGYRLLSKISLDESSLIMGRVKLSPVCRGVTAYRVNIEALNQTTGVLHLSNRAPLSDI